MQKFDSEHCSSQDLRIIQVMLPITLADLMEVTSEGFAERSTSNIIWVFWPGTLQLLNTEDMKSLRRVRANAEGERRNGHTVFVAQDGAEAMFIKWYKVFAESEESQHIRYHLAESIEAAKDLIGALSKKQA